MDFLETSQYFDLSVGLQLLYYIYSIFSYSGNKSWGISQTIAIITNQKQNSGVGTKNMKFWSANDGTLANAE